MAANGRNGPVRSDSSGFERKLVRWCRIRPVVSDWYAGFSVGFSEWQSSREGSHRRPDVNPHAYKNIRFALRVIYSGLYSVSSCTTCCSPTALEVESEWLHESVMIGGVNAGTKHPRY